MAAMKRPPKSLRLHVRIDEELQGLLEHAAEATGREDVASYVRDVLRKQARTDLEEASPKTSRKAH